MSAKVVDFVWNGVHHIDAVFIEIQDSDDEDMSELTESDEEAEEMPEQSGQDSELTESDEEAEESKQAETAAEASDLSDEPAEASKQAETAADASDLSEDDACQSEDSDMSDIAACYLSEIGGDAVDVFSWYASTVSIMSGQRANRAYRKKALALKRSRSILKTRKLPPLSQEVKNALLGIQVA